ncbi:proline-rich receptor-like protein kinase PERK1 [Panicum virgatum]|uniref:proline-rich receptor-like protein kinase PERK1 n=1 Tax=Panicum virgatum TaxID=38727 RepID=UPI0019D52A1E|nr:proline-rich receptor-like protein kinase PERK1 [Panicum virgatum]
MDRAAMDKPTRATAGDACTNAHAVASRDPCTTDAATAVPSGASARNAVRASSGDTGTTNAGADPAISINASATIAFAAFPRGARATSAVSAFSGDARTRPANALPTLPTNASATVTFAAFPGDARAAKAVSAFSGDATATKAAPDSARCPGPSRATIPAKDARATTRNAISARPGPSRGAQTAALAASCTDATISPWPPGSSWRNPVAAERRRTTPLAAFPAAAHTSGAFIAVIVVAAVVAVAIGYERDRNVYGAGPGLPVTSKVSSAPFTSPAQAYSQSQQTFPPWDTSSGVLSGPLRPPPPPPVTGGAVSYAELAAATGGFSGANLLGQGGFGHVYRGALAGAGEVAIKRLRPGSGQGEVEIISRVHHRHLVSLVGYCIHGDHRLLVYEYVPNKTLELHLRGDPRIIHRDIKAANILLDYNFEPKVSDFGLAKIQHADDTHVSTRVMGTFGYLAPEYATTGKVTDRSDVYSFGVVLLELITGKTPVLSSEPYNDETLVSWSRPRLTRALEEDILDGLTDPRMGADYDAGDMRRLIACAAAAVRHTARSLPRMSQIVRYLEGQLSAEALDAGVAPGQSELLEDHAGEQLRWMRRLAFVPGTTTGGFLTGNMSSSYVREPTSEYGLHPSSSSSDGADASEVSSAHREASRPPTTAASSATGAGVEGQNSGEFGADDGGSRRVRPGCGGA